MPVVISNTKDKLLIADVADKLGQQNLADELRIKAGGVNIPTNFEIALDKAISTTKFPADRAVYNEVRKILRAP